MKLRAALLFQLILFTDMTWSTYCWTWSTRRSLRLGKRRKKQRRETVKTIMLWLQSGHFIQVLENIQVRHYSPLPKDSSTFEFSRIRNTDVFWNHTTFSLYIGYKELLTWLASPYSMIHFGELNMSCNCEAITYSKSWTPLWSLRPL